MNEFHEPENVNNETLVISSPNTSSIQVLTEKEKADIELKVKEIKHAKKQLTFDIVKSIVIAIGAIFVFFSIREPEFLRSKSELEEKTKKERAQMLLDLIMKENDPKKILLGVQLIKISYSDTKVNDILTKTEDKITEYSKSGINAQDREYYQQLVKDKSALENQLSQTNDNEKIDILRKQISLLSFEMSQIEKELGIDK